jgi:hypothetical protein
MGPISSAASGILNASARFDAASNDIVSAAASGSSGDLTSAITDQAVAGQQLKASASVLKASDQMFKTLLDITV